MDSDGSTEAYVSSEDEEDEPVDEDEDLAKGGKGAASTGDPKAALERAKEERRKLLDGLKSTNGGKKESAVEKEPKIKTKTKTKGQGPRPPPWLQSPEERRTNWEVKYALTKEFVKEHGRLPTSTIDGTLGYWINYARKTWAKLDADQLAKLRALGVKPINGKSSTVGHKDGAKASTKRTKKEKKENETRPTPTKKTTRGKPLDYGVWQSRLEELERYRAATDGQNPPYFIPVGRWLYEQIALQSQGLLRRYRKKKLERLGVRWDFQEEAGEGGDEPHQESATKKKRKSPQDEETSCDEKGQQTNRETKKRKKSATTGGEENLNGTKMKKEGRKESKSTTKEKRGAPETRPRVEWEDRFARVARYLAIHQKEPPKRDELGKWLTFQRWAASTGRLGDAKITQLQSIGISIPPKQTRIVHNPASEDSNTDAGRRGIEKPMHGVDEAGDGPKSEESGVDASCVSPMVHEALRRVKSEQK